MNMKKPLIIIGLIAAAAVFSQQNVGTLMRVPIATSDFARRILINETAQAWRADLGIPDQQTFSLSALTQSGAAINQIPKWDGAGWVPAEDGGGAITLANIGQSEASQWMVPKWNGVAWVPMEDNFLFDVELADISDSGASLNDVPTWNGSAWMPQAPSGGGSVSIAILQTIPINQTVTKNGSGYLQAWAEVIEVDDANDFTCTPATGTIVVNRAGLYRTSLALEYTQTSGDYRFGFYVDGSEKAVFGFRLNNTAGAGTGNVKQMYIMLDAGDVCRWHHLSGPTTSWYGPAQFVIERVQ